MKTILVAIIAATSLAQAAPGQKKADDWDVVPKLCGKLQHIERIPDKTIPNAYSEKSRPLKNINLRAYERRNDSDCCKTVPIVAETASNRTGAFDFKRLPAGMYWLVATIENREYKTPVRIQQTKNNQPLCSDLSYAIEDSGEFTLRVRVTID